MLTSWAIDKFEVAKRGAIWVQVDVMLEFTDDTHGKGHIKRSITGGAVRAFQDASPAQRQTMFTNWARPIVVDTHAVWEARQSDRMTKENLTPAQVGIDETYPES